MRFICLLVALAIFPHFSQAQMVNGADTLYGNEWIKFQNPYLRIKVAVDGIYRIPFQQLVSGGFPGTSVPASDLRLYRQGVQVPIYTTTENLMSDPDFVEFWGEKNKGAVDRYLTDRPDDFLVNGQYSMFNDTITYYLTWNDASTAKRVVAAQNNLTNLPPKTDWCWYTMDKVYNERYFKREISHDITYSWYDGDGWCIAAPQSGVLNVTLTDMYLQGPPATLKFKNAYNLDQHSVKIKANDTLIVDESHNGFSIRSYSATLPNSKLQGNLDLHFESVGQTFVSTISVRYSHDVYFGTSSLASFELDPNPAGYYLEIPGLNNGTAIPVLYDLNTNQRWEMFMEFDLAKVYLPPNTETRKLVLVNPNSANMSVPAPSLKYFHDFSQENAGFAIITSKALLQDPTAGGANQVQAYADYRASMAGGNYSTTIIDIEELYEQFAYGIRFHPIAIKNFCYYAYKKWPKAKNVFLIGKGLNCDVFRKPAEQQAKFNKLSFLPNIGVIGTDMLYVMSGTRLNHPILSIGRLAATQPFEIKHYLDKVVEHDQWLNSDQTIANKSGLKRFLHISGGMPGEQSLIASYVQGLNDEIKNNQIGASVQTLYKTSNDPVQQPVFDQILESIRSGVSTWTIFGHSSPFIVDYDIGQVENYNNKGKYPFLMILGCFSGQCSNTDKGLGENFVLARDKGAVAYLATVNFGFTDGLYSFGRAFYHSMGNAGYGKTLGDMITNTVDTLQNTNYSTLIAVTHQAQLQGDPAIRLQQSPGPDFLVDPATVTVSPNPVSIDQATFKLNFDLVNLGKRIPGKLTLTCSLRDASDSTRVLKTVEVEAPGFRDKISLDLPAQGIKAGYARLFLTVDPGMSIPEWPAAGELNNDLLDASGEKGIPLYFYAEDVQPLYPPDFSIVFKDKTELFAAALAPRETPIPYLFEIDTVETFNSPIIKRHSMISSSGILSWTPDIPLKDSVVYYWRVARDSLVNGLVAWHTRSFTYVKGSPAGWSQSDFAQYIQDSLINMQLHKPGEQFSFSNNAAQFKFAVAYFQANPLIPSVYINDYESAITSFQWNAKNGIDNKVVVMQIDPITGTAILNPAGSPDNPLGNTPALFHAYQASDSLQRIALMEFLQHGLTPGAYVLVMTVYRYNNLIGYAPWDWAKDSITYGKNLFQILEGYGSKKVRSLANAPQPPYPYGFTFRYQGGGYPALDTIAYAKDSIINIRSTVQAKWTQGALESLPIGPAKHWYSTHWVKGSNDDPSDEFKLSVIGLRSNKPDTLLYQVENTNSVPLGGVDPAVFPYLKLRFDVLDTVRRSPIQLKSWWVFYDGYPEGALSQRFTQWHADTLEQGDSLHARLTFRNISWYDMDSLLVHYSAEGPGGQMMTLAQRLKRVPAGDSVNMSINLSTLQMNGAQRLIVDANPANDQQELHHYNNVAFRNYYVQRDNRNPLLDVTFDGSHIMDGDLISPKPQITLSLKDNNPFFTLQDTNTFSLTLTEPDGMARKIAWNDPVVQFFPGDPASLSKKNTARLEWRPIFTKDGDYSLAVNGRDASGNLSAKLDYVTRFKVITRSTLSNLLNYPNPFSTSTCFVYTMTGAETPAQFKIQIMTVSGKVVREVTTAEFGPLQAGTHRSNFCWDGRDEFGDQLANGVYLYRVVAKKQDGTEFEAFEQNSIDGFFKHGFGKMVLMR
jgi:hypothetical protein